MDKNDGGPALKAFMALRHDVEQFDNHPSDGESDLFSSKVPLAMKSYLVTWLRRFMKEHGDEVESALKARTAGEGGGE